MQLAKGSVKAIKMRAALATSFHAVGRGGEAGLLTWKSLSWDYDEENLSGSWAQQKVLNVLDVNFFADATAYDIDEFHCMACYCIVGGGARFLTPNNNDKEWVFPNLASGSATSILTSFLKDCAVAVGELHVDVTATDLRAGSLCEIVYAEGGGLKIAIARGGWKGKGESLCALFEYLMNTCYAISIGGRILAAYLNPRVRCFPPRLSVVLTDKNQVCFL
jgi:hypothetical protein